MTQPTHLGAWYGQTSAVLAVEPPLTDVRIDGRAQTRVRLDRIEERLGEAPRAWFSAGLGRCPADGTLVRLEQVAPQVRPGALVTARLLRGGVLPGASRHDLVVFEGRVTRIEFALDADGESLRFEAEDPAGDVLRRRVSGQHAWTHAGTVEHLTGAPLAFNPDGQANASDDWYDPGVGDACAVFTPTAPAGAAAWTLDEAVAYLLSWYGHAPGMDAASAGEVRRLVDAVTVHDIRLEGRTLGEAVEALLEPLGGRLRVAVQPQAETVTRRLEVWLPGRAASGWLSHQPPGGVYSPGATQFQGLAVRLEFAAAPRRYVARGDRKVYESTFSLVPGWDDALASYDPDRFSPSANPNFEAVRDVFRKWVLNEAGDYAVYGRGPGADLAAAFEGEPYVRRRRRLLPCLSRDALGRSRGVYVEISLDGGTAWEQASLGLRVLGGECGVYVSQDPLPPAYLVAAMQGLVRVRVTAALESDSCLTAEREDPGAGGLPGRTRHLGAPAGYRFRRVAVGSLFHGQSAADEVDDTGRLQALVDAAFEADRRCPAPARVVVPYLALGHRPGERLLGIRGRRLDLARQHPGYETGPVLCAVRFVFAPVPRTELDLE